MKILLTGASGFLGNLIHDYLIANEMDVDTLGRHKEDSIQADISIAIPAIKGHYDLVIHSAGKAHSVPKTVAEKKLFFDVNLEGTRNLLNSLSENPPKSFVFISSIAVYGIDRGFKINEGIPLNATDPYGLSKIEAEELVSAWCTQHQCICCILRLPLLIGIDAPGNFGKMVVAIKNGSYFRIGDGGGRKSMLLAMDVPPIALALAPLGGTYNLSDFTDPSFAEIETILGENFKVKIKKMPFMIAKLIAYVGDLANFITQRRISPIDTRAYRKITYSLTLDASRLKNTISWTPKSVLDFIKNNIH